MNRRKWCINVRLNAVSPWQLRISLSRNAQLIRFRAILSYSEDIVGENLKPRHVAAMALSVKGTDPSLVSYTAKGHGYSGL